jgi:hypothetical protein
VKALNLPTLCVQAAYLRHFGEDDYAQVAIFPEGTTTNGKALITFHQGAFVPGAFKRLCEATCGYL